MSLVKIELGHIRLIFENIKNKNNYLVTQSEIQALKKTSLYEFLFNHSYLYVEQMAVTCYDVIEIMEKLQYQGILLKEIKEVKEIQDRMNSAAKAKNHESYYEYWNNQCQYFADMGIKYIEKLEELFGSRIPRPIKKYDLEEL